MMDFTPENKHLDPGGMIGLSHSTMMVQNEQENEQSGMTSWVEQGHVKHLPGFPGLQGTQPMFL